MQSQRRILDSCLHHLQNVGYSSPFQAVCSSQSACSYSRGQHGQGPLDCAYHRYDACRLGCYIDLHLGSHVRDGLLQTNVLCVRHGCEYIAEIWVVLGAAFPLFSRRIVREIGADWATSLLRFLSCLFILAPPGFWSSVHGWGNGRSTESHECDIPVDIEIVR